ncbi:FAD dependent oxidoreductase [Macleaya cordata]|uniref:FAD-dependent oxidoreductase domain-containing protein 1 n=1 Tax=Macleaya cordata TaxID=56857 RepID=A0A200QKU1_MACCD|nr:FAD dependent oxidoreductase [Macleaya cordata]
MSASSLEFDVVVVGAGIIGLTIARQFLMGSDDLSVAVVDAAVPCSLGATGAGQGYLWMGHKNPGSDKWELAMRSKRLWDMLAVSIQHQGMDPLDVLGWKRTGSLLIGRTQEEVAMLKGRVKLLSEAGLRAEYLSASDLLLKEPSLEIEKEGGAAFLPDDCQLDARRAAAFIEKENRHFASKSRYAEFYNDPALRLLRSDKSGEVEAVQTSKNTLYCKKAVVIAAGSWSGSLMQNLVRELNTRLDVPVKPRKGHLLVIENFKEMQLNHGLMEVGYVDHQTAAPHCTSSVSSVMDQGQTLSISMTATTDAMGNLVLGSSREFAGFNMEVDDSIIERIWMRARAFFPSLREMSLTDLTKSRKVRIGLRPYMPDGKPIIGPVPGLSKVVLATGHEGEGLLLALGTAEMVADMVLGNPGKLDYAPFSVQGRC